MCLSELKSYSMNHEIASFDLLSASRKASTVTAGSLILHLEANSVFTGAKEMLNNIDQDVGTSGIACSGTVSNVVNLANDTVTQVQKESDLYVAVGQFLSMLEGFKKVVDAVSEVRSRYFFA